MAADTIMNETGGGGISGLSEAIGKLMEHPEILSMAASVLGQDLPTEADKESPPSKKEQNEDSRSDASTANTAKPEALSADLAGALAPILSRIRGSGHKDGAHSLHHTTALLIALKPYLSAPRCEQIDRLVELSKLGAVFENLR